MSYRRRRKTSSKINDLMELEINRVKTNSWYYGWLIGYCFYIVDTMELLKPRFIRRAFDTKTEAENAIKTFLGADMKRFRVENGYTIAKYKVKPYGKYLKNRIGKYSINMKYDYPPNCITAQQKKNFRTMARRRLRERWNKKLGIN